MRVTSFASPLGILCLYVESYCWNNVTTRTRIIATNVLPAERRILGEGAEQPSSEKLPTALIARHSRKAPGRSKGGRSDSAAPAGLLTEDELDEVSERYPDGITAVEIVEIFVSRGVRFSEATFRKYVQQGLLPRSRRIGRKGKHRGSLGVYPAKSVRRVNLIKQLMAQGYTIEEIQEQFLQFTDVVESLDEGLHVAFNLFQADLGSPRFDSKARKSIRKELADARKCADELLGRINGLSKRFSQSRDSYRSTGAAGSAEDLL